MTSTEQTRAHAWVTGRVQGVFFRQSTQDEARRLGLTGWVRNLTDGRVELTAEGARQQVEALLAWCHRGPLQAKVEAVKVEWEPFSGELQQFAVTDDA